MIVEVQFTAQLKREADIGKEQIELDNGKDLRELIHLLFKRYSEGFDAILFDNMGTYRPSVLLVLNGVQVMYDDSNTLHDGDIVTIMSPIAGG